MILMLGPLADSGTANLALTLAGMREDFVILDPRNYGSKWHVDWSIVDGQFSAQVRTPQRTILDTEIRAIWAHMLMLPRLDEMESTLGPPPNIASLIAFVDTFPGCVVNRPSAAASNSVKPYQARLIAQAGFPPIPTLVTTLPDEARKFINKHGEVIFKSISWCRSRVRRVEAEDIERINSVQNCPTQFQKYIPGNDVRVHRVGDRLFATEISSSADDYRYVPMSGVRTMKATTLPKGIERRCFDVANALGLDICGIDLRRTPDGEHYCFEVNPIPGYLFYEQFTGQRIGDAIAQWLCAPAHATEGSRV